MPGGGQVESSFSQGCLHPREPRHGQRQESSLSPRALQPLPGSFTTNPVSSGQPRALSLPGPQVFKGQQTGRSLGARVPVRGFSHGKKRAETLL